MSRLSSHGGFDPELLAKVKEELSGNLEFSEQQEPLDRNKAGMPSIIGFAEQHFDFRQCSRGAGDTYGIPDNKKCRQGADMGPGKKEEEKKGGSSGGKSGGGDAKPSSAPASEDKHPGANLPKGEVQMLSRWKRSQATTDELKNQNRLITEQMKGASSGMKASLREEKAANTAEIKSRASEGKAAPKAAAAPKADASAGLVNGKLSSKHPDAIADKAARKELADAKKELAAANGSVRRAGGKTGRSGGSLSALSKSESERLENAEKRVKAAEAKAKQTGDKVKKTTSDLLKKGGGGAPSKPTGTPNKEGEFDARRPSRGVGKERIKELEMARNRARREAENQESRGPAADKKFSRAMDNLRIEKQKQSIQNRADKLTAGQTFKVQGKEYRVNSDGSYQLVDS